MAHLSVCRSSAPLLLAGFQGQVPIADWVSPPPQTSSSFSPSLNSDSNLKSLMETKILNGIFFFRAMENPKFM